MIIASFILSAINLLILLGILINYFRQNYTIQPMETWNLIANVYNDAVEKNLIDEEGNLIATPNIDAAGGFGFFKEQVEEYYEDEEDKK